MVYFTPLVLLNLGLANSVFWVFLLYLISGLGMAGIGMGVMHDAIHGSYSKSGRVNRYLGYTMNLIGANAAVWKIQHNVLHHTYTNIDHADDDLNVPFFLRFSPHAKRYWLHRYQHFYVWIFYGLSTLSWVTVKDFIRINRYRNMGFLKRPNEFRYELLKLIAWKMVYYTYALIIPMLVSPFTWWITLLAFVWMHIITGLLISTVFQTAHVMPEVEYPLPNKKGEISNHWAIHQLHTTTNFSPHCAWFSWLIGGLNFQIEHHLLPNICHVHYRKLSPIVAATAKECGVPYNMKKSFLSAVWSHIIMLQQLGRKPVTDTTLA